MRCAGKLFGSAGEAKANNTYFCAMMKGFAYTLLIVALLSAISLRAQYSDHRNRKTDSLEMVLNNANSLSDNDLMRTYIGLMWGYLQTDGEKSQHYAQNALELSHKMNALNARVDALRILGLNHYGRDDYEKAIEYYNDALAVTEQMNGDKRYSEADIDDNMSSLYGSIANVYNMEGKAQLAIHYYQLALPFFEKHGWMESTAILYHNVADLYHGMGNVEEAERNELKSLEAAKSSGDSLLIALPHKGLAKLYLGRGDVRKAEESVQISHDYYSRHKAEESSDYIVTLLTMARIQLNHYQDVEKAETLVDEALEWVDEVTWSETVGDAYNAVCEIAMERKQWRKAEEYAWKAINAGEEETYNDLGSFVYLTQIYAELGETQKVNECVVKIFNGMEAFATANYQSSLSQMEVIYETEKKQAAIEQLENERRWYTIGSILVGFILLLLMVLFFLLWRNVRQSKQNAVVKAKLDGELGERVRIAHDLHDRMGGLLTAIKQNVTTESQVDKLTDEAIREMRNVAHHLLPGALQRHGLRTALYDYCQTMKKVSFAFYGEDKHIEHEEVTYCIVHELVNNAVKSAEASHIQVQLIVNEESTTINVSDDGNGMIGQNDGMGLQNIRERVEAIGGKMDVYAKPGEGSEINIEFTKDGKKD